MTEFLDMNDECIEYVLKYCDAESIVAASQTCKKLQPIATRLFKDHTIYKCSIASDENGKRVKSTIAHIGNNLVELNVNFAKEYKKIDSVFFKRLPQKCPNLQTFGIVSHASIKAILKSFYTLEQLQHLSIHSWDHDEHDGSLPSLQKLQSLVLDVEQMDLWFFLEIILKAENLKYLKINNEYGRCIFEADNACLQKIKSSEDPGRTYISEWGKKHYFIIVFEINVLNFLNNQ